MKRVTLDEMLDEVKHRVGISTYHYENGSWFMPNDIAPHSSRFKYRCKKLYEAGLLERQGTSRDRWGYSYRVKLLEGLEG